MGRAEDGSPLAGRPTSQLLRQALSRARELAREEVGLAATEGKAQLLQEGGAAALMIGAGIFAVLTMLLALAAAVLAIGGAIHGHYASAALIVAAGTLVLGGASAALGWGLRVRRAVPTVRRELQELAP